MNKKPKPKPFVIYIPELNQIDVCNNTYGLDFVSAMVILKLGLKDSFTIEFIGEL